MSDNLFGNATTIVKFLVCMIFPYVSAYGVTESMLTAILSLILGFIVALLDAKYHNTFAFLGNAPVTSEAQSEEDIISTNDYEAEC